MCLECYSQNSRITPLLNVLSCLSTHTQYICGTCGRCICIEHENKSDLQRWNFPFKTIENAKLYLRAADYTKKAPCGIYEMENMNGKVFYKIFASLDDLTRFIKKNPSKVCKKMSPMFSTTEYKEFAKTQVRKLTTKEIQNYLHKQ